MVSFSAGRQGAQPFCPFSKDEGRLSETFRLFWAPASAGVTTKTSSRWRGVALSRRVRTYWSRCDDNARSERGGGTLSGVSMDPPPEAVGDEVWANAGGGGSGGDLLLENRWIDRSARSWTFLELLNVLHKQPDIRFMHIDCAFEFLNAALDISVP